jgi:hypothetical protein
LPRLQNNKIDNSFWANSLKWIGGHVVEIAVTIIGGLVVTFIAFKLGGVQAYAANIGLATIRVLYFGLFP